MMPLRVAQNESSPGAAATEAARAAPPSCSSGAEAKKAWDYLEPLKDAPAPPASASASASAKPRRAAFRKSASERPSRSRSADAAEADRRSAFAANGKSVSENLGGGGSTMTAMGGHGRHRRRSSQASLSRSPSFSKIDLDDSPLNDEISVATMGTAVSALTMGTGAADGGGNFADDLRGYVRNLRRDMVKAKEEALLAQAAAEASGEEECRGDGGEGGSSSAEEVEKYKDMVETLQNELAAMNKRLEEQKEELERRQKLGSSESEAPALAEVTIPSDRGHRGPKTGPWRKLAKRLAQTGGGGGAAPSSVRSVVAPSSSASVASLGSAAATAVTAPAHLDAPRPASEDPRVSTVRSLRELLTQLEFQNGLREQSVRSMGFTRDSLEKELDEERNEQLRLTMKNLDDEESLVSARRHLDVELAGEVAQLRKRIERGHREVEILKRKVALWSGEPETEPKGEAADIQRGEERSRKTLTRASFADVGHLLLSQSSEGQNYARQAAHHQRKREERASIAEARRRSRASIHEAPHQAPQDPQQAHRDRAPRRNKRASFADVGAILSSGIRGGPGLFGGGGAGTNGSSSTPADSGRKGRQRASTIEHGPRRASGLGRWLGLGGGGGGGQNGRVSMTS